MGRAPAPAGRGQGPHRRGRDVGCAFLHRPGPAGLDPVDRRSPRAVTCSCTSQWWTNSAARASPPRPRAAAARSTPSMGTLLQGLTTAVISVPIGIMTAIYLVEYGRGPARQAPCRFMVDILTGIPSIVAALFIYACGSRPSASSGSASPSSPRAGAADGPGRRALHRGDAQAGARTSCARRRTPSACRSGRRSSGSCCRRRSPASSPASLLGLARVMGETAPLLILGPYTQVDRNRTCSAAHADAAHHDQPGPHSTARADRRRPCLGRGAAP